MLSEQERELVSARLSCRVDPGLTFCFCLSPDGLSAVGIVNAEQADDAYQDAFGTSLLERYLTPVLATAGMGKIYGDVSLLGKSYIEAYAAINYRLVKGKNTCIPYAAVYKDSAETAFYPQQMLENYVSCLRNWDAEEIKVQLLALVDYIRQNHLSLQQIKCVCFELTSSFLKEIGNLGAVVSWKVHENFDVFNIAEYDSVSELVEKITDFSLSIQQFINDRKVKGGDIIVQCCELMQQNIENAQFSLVNLSERFGVTPQTLRRKFKEATGRTLSDYFTDLRICRAKELLTGSELSQETICARCGYLDMSSFIRMFKAEVGMPPGKFRETQQKAPVLKS